MSSRKRLRLHDFIVSDDEEEEDEEWNQSDSSDYFSLDADPLQREICNLLSTKFGLDSKEVLSTLEHVFQTMELDSLEPFLAAKPSDKSWKIGLDRKKIKKLEPQLRLLRKEMKSESPTIDKILEAAITKSDKKRALRLFDQLQNTEPFTQDYFTVQDCICEILGKAKYSDYAETVELEKEEDYLSSLIPRPDNLKNRILRLSAEPEIKAKLLGQYREMTSYPPESNLYLTLKEEIEWGLRLPYNKTEIQTLPSTNSKLNLYFLNIKKQLDAELYGMNVVKNKILHILNDKLSAGNCNGRNIALVGPPGVGKTQIGKVLGKILGKKFIKISAGALDSALLKGSNKVWQGSEPSIILQKMAEIGTSDCIIMFDEVDKMGNTPNGKLAQYALLHISDPENNKEFQDNYLKNYSHDLSNVFFIYNMNDDTCIDEALKDRFDIIRLPNYSEKEKSVILTNYMIPKFLKNINLERKSVQFSPAAIGHVLALSKDSLRTVEKIVKNVLGKINMYKNCVLKDGTLGDLDLGYVIPNFKLPMKINGTLIKILTKDFSVQ